MGLEPQLGQLRDWGTGSWKHDRGQAQGTQRQVHVHGM